MFEFFFSILFLIIKLNNNFTFETKRKYYLVILLCKLLCRFSLYGFWQIYPSPKKKQFPKWSLDSES